MNLILVIAMAILFSACQSADRLDVGGDDPAPVNLDAEVLTVAFYNVENLFDTFNDPATADDDFTPSGALKWTEERLEEKLENLSRAIRSINENNGPDILGLCEVENLPILERLVNQYLPEGVYGIVHTDSPDGRGIDVALLYRKSEMLVKGMVLHPVPLSRNDRPTRGILEVTFEKGGQFFTLLVNHWPSRSGGQKESESKRLRAATVAGAIVDSLTQLDPNVDIIMLGDFNDEPDNLSIQDRLKGIEYRPGEEFTGRMINLAAPLMPADTIGTYLYKDDWEVIDQILVSPGALDNKGIVLRDPAMTIFHPEFLRDYHPSQPLNPPRHTYVRRSLYIGGTSDHFPVFVRLGWR